MPKVSVIMACYNAEKYLCESIDSILSQSFQDFEFIIIDDASTDSTASIILSYSDNRIVYLRNESNRKLSYSLNRGLAIAKGDYVARMDADDISQRNRLLKQVKFLDTNPDYGVVGSAIQMFGRDNKVVSYPSSHKTIYYDFIAPNRTIAHPAAMLRRSVLVEHNLSYDESFDVAQDYKLWNELKHVCKLTNLQAPLLRYRTHVQSATKTKRVRQLELVQLVRRSELAKMLGDKDLEQVSKIIILRDLSTVSLLDLILTLFKCRIGLSYKDYKWYFLSYFRIRYFHRITRDK